MNIRTVVASQWPSLATFLHAQNRAPALCLHSQTGSTLAAYMVELAALPPHEACFAAADSDEGCIGVMGAEFSRESKRAWLRGPVVDATLQNPLANQTRDLLWEQLLTALPAEITRLDAFLEVSHDAGLAWYRQQGFSEQARYFIYEAQRSPTRPVMPANVQAAATQHHASLLELAHLVFATGYLTAAELTAVNSDQHALFVIAEGDRVDGYVYANIINATTDEAELYVDYLVVRPEARGRQLGRTLLQAALHWGFVERDVSRAALTVAGDNANAQNLYASVGFALAATGLPMRLDRA